MGLDMYINATLYLSEYGKDKPILDAIKGAAQSAFEGFKINGIKVELGYWRKANAIHSWFVKNVQEGIDECQDSPLAYGHLEKLKAGCEQVLADHSKAAELLPCQSGFFFGSAHFDEWYFKDLEKTVKIIDAIFANPLLCGEYSGGKYLQDGIYYRSSW